MQRYDIVLLDPPWWYYGPATKWAAAGKHYDLIPDEDMLRLDIASYLNPKRSIAFIWATGPRKGFAYKCIEAWGLHERGEAFHWIKTKADGTPIKAQGVRASITKPLVETVLAASPMAKGRPLPIADESVPQTIFCDPAADLESDSDEPQTIYAPRGEHSEKPEEIYQRIERMYPNASKLELFARKRRPGWDAVGNQLDPPSLVRMRPAGPLADSSQTFRMVRVMLDALQICEHSPSYGNLPHIEGFAACVDAGYIQPGRLIHTLTDAGRDMLDAHRPTRCRYCLNRAGSAGEATANRAS